MDNEIKFAKESDDINLKFVNQNSINPAQAVEDRRVELKMFKHLKMQM